MSIAPMHDTRWTVHAPTRFDSFRRAWDTLNVGALNAPFLDSRFICSALKSFGDGSEIIGVVGPDAAPEAIGIFRRRRPGIWETFQPSQLPLGAFVAKIGPATDQLL